MLSASVWQPETACVHVFVYAIVCVNVAQAVARLSAETIH